MEDQRNTSQYFPSITADSHSPVITHTAKSNNPAVLYLMTMGTEQSRSKVMQLLNHIARQFGYLDLQMAPWEQIQYAQVLALRTKLEMEGKLLSTINLTLSVIKGVAKQA